MGGHGFEPDDVFAGYRIVQRLGTGGEREVHLIVHHRSPDEPQPITPRFGVPIDSRVGGAAEVAVERATAGSGTCGIDHDEVFLTSAQAFR